MIEDVTSEQNERRSLKGERKDRGNVTGGTLEGAKAEGGSRGSRSTRRTKMSKMGQNALKPIEERKKKVAIVAKS